MMMMTHHETINQYQTVLRDAAVILSDWATVIDSLSRFSSLVDFFFPTLGEQLFPSTLEPFAKLIVYIIWQQRKHWLCLPAEVLIIQHCCQRCCCGSFDTQSCAVQDLTFRATVTAEDVVAEVKDANHFCYGEETKLAWETRKLSADITKEQHKQTDLSVPHVLVYWLSAAFMEGWNDRVSHGVKRSNRAFPLHLCLWGPCSGQMAL